MKKWREHDGRHRLYTGDFTSVGGTLVKSLGVWQKMSSIGLGTGISAYSTAPDGSEHQKDGFWTEEDAMKWVEGVFDGTIDPND